MTAHKINRSTDGAAYGRQPAIEAREAAISAAQAEQARRAACFDDLLAALQAVLAEHESGYGLTCERMVRAAIANATKEQP